MVKDSNHIIFSLLNSSSEIFEKYLSYKIFLKSFVVEYAQPYILVDITMKNTQKLSPNDGSIHELINGALITFIF